MAIATIAPSALGAASSRAPHPTSASRSPTARPREGETSVEALFQRARAALLEGDDHDLVLCLFPDARRAWLRDALLAIEVEAQVPRYEDALARRRALGSLRDRVLLHVRDRETPSRPRELSAEIVGDALLDRVDAPDELLAELLGVARGLGHPLDPVAAATLGRAVVPGEPARPVAVGAPPPPPPDRAGLARALRRIDRSTELAEVHLVDDRGIALVRDASGGLEPVRLVRRGDIVWIDES